MSASIPNTMKEAIVFDPIRVEVRDAPVPQPAADQILTKVIVSGSNPKDWKLPVWNSKAQGTNQGDDIAGIVVLVGDKVTQFKPGDRVGAFHHMQMPGGSYAEYALSPEHTTFHIPDNVSFEEAATIPLAAMTAALGLFVRLGLPEPWISTAHPDRLPKGGILIYGAASAVGAFAVKLATRANIHPILAVAGKGIPFVESLIDKSKGDAVIDYREGSEKLVAELKKAVDAGAELEYAFDCVSEQEKGSFDNISQVLSPRGNLTVVLPGGDLASFPSTVTKSDTLVGTSFKADKDFAYAWFRLFELGLKDGWFNGHPHEVIPGGLYGVEQALKNLKEGKVSATKYVFTVGETEGVGK